MYGLSYNNSLESLQVTKKSNPVMKMMPKSLCLGSWRSPIKDYHPCMQLAREEKYQHAGTSYPTQRQMANGNAQERITGCFIQLNEF